MSVTDDKTTPASFSAGAARRAIDLARQTLQIEADHCGEACGQPSAAKDDDHAGHDHAATDAQGHRGHVHR